MRVKRLDEILGLKEKDVYRQIFENFIQELDLVEFEKIKGSQLSEEEVFGVHQLAYNLAFPLSKSLPFSVLKYKLKRHELIRKRLGFYPGRTVNFWVYVDEKPARIVGRLDAETYIKDQNQTKVYGVEIKTFGSPSSLTKQLKIAYLQSHMYAYGSRIFDWILFMVKDVPDLEKIRSLEELREKNYIFPVYLSVQEKNALNILSTAVKVMRVIRKYQTSLL